MTDPRRACNNIFVAAYPTAGMVRPIAFLPPDDFDGRSDGNIYARVPASTHHRFAVTDHGVKPGIFANLEGQDGYRSSFGHEASGKQIEPPPFVSFASDGHRQPEDDDLRHRWNSPQAITMPGEMKPIERGVGGILALLFGRARGCYWVGFDRMWVGVGGQQRFPD